MPATTSIRIVIAPAGQTGQPAPPSPNLWMSRTIRLEERPSAGSRAFALRVSAGAEARESLLSAGQSERLAALLAELPEHGLVAGPMSFDGVEYELVLLRVDGSLVFQWQNEDWRLGPPDSRDAWERVAALADFALQLADEEGARL